MNIIIKNDNFKIGQDQKDNKLFTIFFDSYNEALIKSIAKTRIILGATTTEKYTTLTFKASSVFSFSDFQKEMKRETGSSRIAYDLSLNMTHNLVTQLNYLITHFSQSFLGYSLENLIVIDKHKFVYLSGEYLLDINDDENIFIKSPFSSSDFFWAPELLIVKEIPAFIHYKVSYFSLACLILNPLLDPLLDPLLGKVEQNEERNTLEHFKNKLNTLSIKNTKLFWLLERCLVEEPKNRSILFI
jgi:hypothetical protein